MHGQRYMYVVTGSSILLFGGVIFLPRFVTEWEPEHSVRRSLVTKRFVHNNLKEEHWNQLSTLLHDLKRNIVKLACQFEEYNLKLEKTSPGDPDCERILTADLITIPFDTSFADELATWRFNKTLAIFGDHSGIYKNYLDSKPSAKHCSSYADDVPASARSNDGVQYLDLRVPQYTLPIFEWMLVFLHIEPQTGREMSVVVDNLVRHANIGLVIIWAGSVDTENKAAVHDVLKKTMVFDPLKTRKLRDICRSYFKENIFVYSKNSKT